MLHRCLHAFGSMLVHIFMICSTLIFAQLFDDAFSQFWIPKWLPKWPKNDLNWAPKRLQETSKFIFSPKRSFWEPLARFGYLCTPCWHNFYGFCAYLNSVLGSNFVDLESILIDCHAFAIILGCSFVNIIWKNGVREGVGKSTVSSITLLSIKASFSITTSDWHGAALLCNLDKLTLGPKLVSCNKTTTARRPMDLFEIWKLILEAGVEIYNPQVSKHDLKRFWKYWNSGFAALDWEDMLLRP